MPRLSFFRRENLTEEENRRWMIYWAVYGATVFAFFLLLDKSGIGLSLWERLGIALGTLAIFGAVYVLDTKRRKRES